MSISQYLFLVLWPFVSLVLGLVSGILVSLWMTLMFFAVTLVRTPINIAKTLYVTATTEKCFTWYHPFDPILRLAVLLLVPIPHLLFLVLVPSYAISIGTLYYVGKATKTIFKQQYSKALESCSATLRFEPETHLGSYLKEQDRFWRDNRGSEDIIMVLKNLCSFIPGIPLGALAFIPFTVSIVAITLYRLPINVFLTLKVAVRTVTLKWDLKICALIMLPVAHALFPLVVFVTALVGSFFFFTFCTSSSIANSKSPFEEWHRFNKGIKEYYKAHEAFVGQNSLGRYDHPTGIPTGWGGETYGLPIQKILRWQWQFVVCCCLLLFSFPICLVGSTLVFSVKLVPGIISWWRKLWEHVFFSGKAKAEILGFWPFWAGGFVLAPAAAVVVSAAATFAGAVICFRIPYEYLMYGWKAGLYGPFGCICDVDTWDLFCLNGWRVFAYLPATNPYQGDDNRQVRPIDRNAESKRFSDGYWDKFASQCILTIADLLAKKWVKSDDVSSFDASILQAVPAISLLTILHDSIRNPETKNYDDISWKIDGTVCKQVEHKEMDNIAKVLWPKIIGVRRFLESTPAKKPLTKDFDVLVVSAMLCFNTDEPTETLRDFIKDHADDECPANSLLRSKLVELSFMILQIKPFQDRMSRIFNYNHETSDIKACDPPNYGSASGNAETTSQNAPDGEAGSVAAGLL